MPVHMDEYQALLKAPPAVCTSSALNLSCVRTDFPPQPLYGCAQCSSSVQGADCVFQGWGKRCGPCQIGRKSLCSFHAEPFQRYAARRELALFAEATPECKSSSTCVLFSLPNHFLRHPHRLQLSFGFLAGFRVYCQCCSSSLSALPVKIIRGPPHRLQRYQERGR